MSVLVADGALMRTPPPRHFTLPGMLSSLRG